MTVTSNDHLSGHMVRVAKALLGAPNQSLSKQGNTAHIEGAPPRGTRWLVAEVCDE